MTAENYFYGTVIQDGAERQHPDIPSGEGIREAYEVIRVIGSKPLFLEDHIVRLERTAALSGLKLGIDEASWSGAFARLIRVNGIREGNIRLSVFFDRRGAVLSWILGFTPHTYPSEEMFLRGVNVLSMPAMRHDPNAKIVNVELRSESDRLKARDDVYEAILIDSEGRVTEGSRSNVFFVKDGRIVTSPDELVLEGVTRKVVLGIITELGIPLEFRAIHLDEVGAQDACFLTGTSRDVLPVAYFDGRRLDAGHPLLRRLRAEYGRVVGEYLSKAY